MKTLRLFIVAPVLVGLLACEAAQPPATRELVILEGTAYDRGLQHGTKLRSKIRSFYTTLLTNSLYPYLGRERPDIASLLTEYNNERYLNGQFAYQLLLDSAKSIERSLPRSTREELQGLSEGSGLTYDEVLILNTFMDSVLAVRGVALAIRLGRSPTVESVEFIGAATDGVDNDGDADIDEAGEGTFAPYIPVEAAQAVELPLTTGVRVLLKDADGVDPGTVRITFGGVLYVQGGETPGLTFRDIDATTLEATVQPTQPLAPGSAVTVVISAGDKKIVDQPPPSRASFMRDEELVFTTRGAGLVPRDVRRPPLFDGRTRAPALALAVKGSATAGGKALLAQNFALLDANTSYKHTVQLVHKPDTGPAFTTVGWAGVTFGLSGMSARGLGYACNPSDTLDNSVVGSVLNNILDLSKAKLAASGMPIGIVGRRMLETATDTASAVDLMETSKHAYGWTCVIADAAGGLEAVEVDSNIFNNPTGVFTYTPAERDMSGRRYSSVGDDDLEIASVYSKNTTDIATLNLAGQRIVPQRQWSSYFARSRRAIDGLKGRVEAQYGTLDVDSLKKVLSEEEFVDKSDSMNAAVYDLNAKVSATAMGQVPATSGPFVTYDLAAGGAH